MSFEASPAKPKMASQPLVCGSNTPSAVAQPLWFLASCTAEWLLLPSPKPARQEQTEVQLQLARDREKEPPGGKAAWHAQRLAQGMGGRRKKKKRVIVDLQAPPPPRHRNRSSSPAAVNFEIGRHRRPLFNELRYSCLSLPSIHTYTCSSYSAICIWLLQLQPGNKPRFVGWRRLRPSIILATLG